MPRDKRFCDGRTHLSVLTLVAMLSTAGAARAESAATRPAAATQPAGRTWYIALDGSDRWGGRLPEANANKTDGPFRTIQRAANVAQAGDTILIRGGDYDLTRGYPQSVIGFAHSGRPGQPITVSGFNDERVTLHTSSSRGVFDFTVGWGHRTGGFGHYVFRKLVITGGRAGWMFVPEPLHRWTPARPIADLWRNQIHDVVIEDCEVDAGKKVDTGIYCRNAGVRNLTVRRCNFHDTIGTEATVDIGEWKSDYPAHAVPRSASHDLLFEDCDFHDSHHAQADGIVTQPTVFNVTLRRCRAWNNGKYGFALKGSGNFRLDRCAAWGNNSSQMYCRGFGTDTGAPRPPGLNEFLLTNCIFIAPADQRGGSALNWRENSDIVALHCTIIGLRKTELKQPGGYSFLLGEQPDIPVKAVLRNCIVAGFNDSPVMRLHVADDKAFVPNVTYAGDNNLFFCTAETAFRYQGYIMSDISEWQTLWARGRPDGDDGVHGPRPTNADAASKFADPKFVGFDPAAAPLSKDWSAPLFNPANHADVRVGPGSPAIGLGENLSKLGIPELMQDYEGRARPATGPWTAGACGIAK